MENDKDIRLPWPDWKIVKYLGGGTYGKVYEIERNISGIQEKAALKIISRPKNADEIESYYDNGYDKASIVASYENEIQNYVQEYKLMKELQGQSNIVSCDDFTVIPHENKIGGDIFIRMELLTSLQQILRERSLVEEEVIKLGKDISRALILCERKHIVHRDIKPVNIMMSPFGDYKLGDFGVSKIMDHSTFATAMGTPEYQAPEVVHMEKYGQTADIYSLGITLYWLLNNRKMPFIGADEMLTPMVKTQAMERRYRGEKLPAPRDGSAALKQIVLKACEYRPEDRHASASELYEALDALKNEKTISDKATEVHAKTVEFGWDESDAWGNSVGTIGIPRDKAQNKHYTAEEFNANPGDIFGKLFEAETSETVGVKIVKLKNVRKEKKASGGQKNISDAEKDIRLCLEKISSYSPKFKMSVSGLLMALFGGVNFIFVGGLFTTTPPVGWIVGPITIFIGCLICFYSFREGIGKWSDSTKTRLPNLDELIKKNPEFARQLYYKKGQHKDLLKYIEKLNPVVAKEIKAFQSK